MLLVTLAISACYRSAPLMTQPQPGTRVAATLTPEGSAAMQNMIGPLVIRVEGVVTGVEADRWTMNMISTTSAAGAESAWRREPVVFPTAYFGTTQQRELNRRLTVLTVGGAVVLALVLGRTFVSGFLGGSDPDDGEVPSQ